MYKFATYKDQYKANLRLALPVPAGCTAAQKQAALSFLQQTLGAPTAAEESTP